MRIYSFRILFQSGFSTECDLLLCLLNFSISSFPQGHPIAAYVFFLNAPSLLSCLGKNVEEDTSSRLKTSKLKNWKKLHNEVHNF
jgi:hypothetical protein